MAAGTTIQHKRKEGAFVGTELAAGEFGVDTTNGVVYFSTNGSTVTTPLPDDSVTNAKLSNMAASTIKARVTGSTGDPEDATVAQIQTMLGLSTAGAVIQHRVHQINTKLSTTSTTIPFDDTIPQSGEGAEVMSFSFTPRSASTRLHIRFESWVTASVIAGVTATMFDGGASAIGATIVLVPGVNYTQVLGFCSDVASGSTSARNISVRWATTSGTAYMLRRGDSANLYSTSPKTILSVTEYYA